jgi:hypothetical protein
MLHNNDEKLMFSVFVNGDSVHPHFDFKKFDISEIKPKLGNEIIDQQKKFCSIIFQKFRQQK